MRMNTGKKTALVTGLIFLFGVALSVLIKHLPHALRKSYGDPLQALLVLVVGGAISFFLERGLNKMSSGRLGARRLTTLRFMSRLILYLAIFMALLAAFGVGLSSVAFGGAFVTVIIGLAGQSFFANLIAGIGLVVFHPFEVGERITFVAWQYPILMPSYPHEAMKPGYTGVITDINLMYTSLNTEEGVPMMIPNGIIIQAAIHNHAKSPTRWIRFRFEVSMQTNPDTLLAFSRELLKDQGWNGRVQIVDIAPASYSVLFVIDAHGRREEDLKGEALRYLVAYLTTGDNPTAVPEGG